MSTYLVQLRIAKVNPFPPIDETSTSRRITLFDQLGKSPDSGPSRSMITASSKYGFTSGGYQAEYLELSEDGYVAFNPEESLQNRLKAKFNLIICGNEYFKAIYER